MNPVRFVLAAGAIVFIWVAVANVMLWHNYYWVGVAWYAVILLFLAIFEVNRYRPFVDRSASTWQPTDERFIDPTTGTETVVWYDPKSGKRDYRPG